MTRLGKWLLVSAAAATFSAGLALAQHPTIAPPKVEATAATTVPFELFRGNRVIVDAMLNGQATPAMLDTGAGATTLDRAFARSIGIPEGRKIQARGAGGTVDAELVSGVTLEIGGIRFTDMSVAVMDLEPIARQLGRPLPLIVGRELFNNAAITFDWDAGRLTVTPASQFHARARATVLAVERRGPFNFVKVSAAGLPEIDALLDLGNGGVLSLPSDYWEKQPRLAGLRYAETQAGGVGGLHAVRAVTLPSLTFAGRTFSGVPAILGANSRGGDAAHGANLGIGMLKQFELTLDLGRDRILLAPRSTPVPFDRDRAGIRTDFASDRLKVSFISPQSPAVASGLKIGDEIVAVNGVPVGPDFYTRSADWNRAPTGTPVRLRKADGSEVTITLQDYY